jgi:prepilin-type N-terminal cleavage/methylation domain-containing protein/prepilin-type processing-associated H-X9-DG protein
MKRRSAFTLVELLVVIAIIGTLVALLLPAVQKVREAANRMKCSNNLKQLALAAHHCHDTTGAFPAGYANGISPESPTTPTFLRRWSWIAMLTPYLEQTNIYNTLDLKLPLYSDPQGDVFPVNQFGVNQVVATLFCPSDSQTKIDPSFGPTNYVACLGDGANGGPRQNSDGIFFNNSHIKIADILDGTSNTAMFSETLLGRGDTPPTDPTQVDVRYTYGTLHANEPVTAAIAASITTFATDRGSRWADGECQYSLYDHHYPPDATVWDAVLIEYSWKAARSHHSQGVNVAFADGSVHFITDGVDLAVWQGLGTRNGGEVPGDY